MAVAVDLRGNANAAEDWSSWPFDFEIIELKEIIVDDSYQRALKGHVIEGMERDGFMPMLAGVITCNRRTPKRLAVIDGQTRCEGAKRNGFKILPAIVFDGISVEQEADLFALIQMKRRNIGSHEKFKAAVRARHAGPVEIQKILTEFNLHIGSPNESNPNVISAPMSLEYVYGGAMKLRSRVNETPHPKLLRDTLQVIRGAWPDNPSSARSAQIIKGIGFFLAQNQNIDLERLIDRLSKGTPSAIVAGAQSLRAYRNVSGSITPSDVAEAIQVRYAKQR